MKIKVKKTKLFSNVAPEIIKKGDWIDLRAAEDIHLDAPAINEKGIVEFQTTKIPLGIAMKLPAGCEAIVAPRSSTYGTFGVIAWNSIGVIDNTYQGNNDEWKFGAIALKEAVIKKGDRICQFRIQLSQKATFWQKLKWLFARKLRIELVDNLSGANRSGFGEGTGAR